MGASEKHHAAYHGRDAAAANRAELAANDGPIICPECVAGKHTNCDGVAWDAVADDLHACECPEAHK